MGAARLLAKAWVLVCLYAAAHALRAAFMGGAPALQSLFGVGVCLFLFGAMGLLFIAGYGSSAAAVGTNFLARLKPRHMAPGFNELVFMVFVLASFLGQVDYAPALLNTDIGNALEGAIAFVVPGQNTLANILAACSVDGGRILASAFSWLLALIYLASAISRIRLAAGIVRLERKDRPEALGATLLTFLLGICAVIGIQLFYVGSGYGMLDCFMLMGLAGQVLIGIGPLMLAYLVVAALTSLFALSPETKH